MKKCRQSRWRNCRNENRLRNHLEITRKLRWESVITDSLWPAADIVRHSTTLLLLHPFNGLFSRTTWISRYQKGKTSLDLNEAKDGGVRGCSSISWTICKQSAPRSRKITTPTPHHPIFTGRMLLLMPNQQCQSMKVQLPMYQIKIYKLDLAMWIDWFESIFGSIFPPVAQPSWQCHSVNRMWQCPRNKFLHPD